MAVQSLPQDLDEREIVSALALGWGFEAATIDYAPLGFGSYHWVATDRAGTRRFVTVDDLEHKPQDTRDRAFARLRNAFDTALALRTDGGLAFVIAPLPTGDGDSVVRLADRHAMTVFPFTDGHAGSWGDPLGPPDRDVLALLVGLHQAPATASAIAPPWEHGPPGRSHLESALRNRDTEWTGGPYSEAARGWVNDRAADLQRELERFDHLAATVAAGAPDLVVTHGEPHAGNTIATDDGLALIDWDTVALGPPERDLWLVAAAGCDLAPYADATGHEPDATALDLYRLGWDLSDIAAYTSYFRSAHEDNEDGRQSWLLLDRMVLR